MRRPTGPETLLDRVYGDDCALAAHGAALGVALLYSFGNVCAVAAHPRRESIVRVHLLKGLPES